MSIGKTVHVLRVTDEDADTEILGVYSSHEAAKIQAQIYLNAMADSYGDPRYEIEWETHPTRGYSSAFIDSNDSEFQIDQLVLDADVVFAL